MGLSIGFARESVDHEGSEWGASGGEDRGQSRGTCFGGASCWIRNASWHGMHQWPRDLWFVAAIKKIDGRHARIYGGGHGGGCPDAGASLMNGVAFVSGVVFGLGLLLSGMTNPVVVLSFLDIAGDWRPDLAFVMGGGLLLGLPVFAWLEGRGKTLLGSALALPNTQSIDRKLLLGAALFGAGWGLAGFCPGPALVAMSMGLPEAWIFGLSMLLGMALYHLRFER